MRDSQFDDILKNKLNGLTSDKSPDWTRFLQEKQIADKADATPEAIDQDFDAQIKGSIDAHKVTRVPQWAAFLDKKTTLDNLADFDAQAKTALKRHKTQTPSQWDAFKAYKAKHTAKDSPSPNSGKEITVLPFDTLVKDTLSDFQSNSKPDWAAFLDYKTQNEGVSPEAAQFDLQVKRELESYRAAETPAWIAFLDAKTASDIDYFDDAPHAEFDAELSYLTDQVQVASPADWSSFKEYRDSQQFDGDIRSTLDDHQSDRQPQWEAFLKRKKEKDGVVADVTFDKGIGGTLGRATAKYNSKHWLMLQARLQRIAALRKGIASYKGLETLFVALMLFTFCTHLGTLMNGVLSPPLSTQEVVPMAEVGEIVKNKVAPIPTQESGSTDPIETASRNERNEPVMVEPVGRQANKVNIAKPSSNSGSRMTISGSNQGNRLTRNSDNNSGGSLSIETRPTTTTPVIDEVIKEGPVANALMAQLDDIVSGLDRMKEKRTFWSPVAEEYVDPNIKKTYRDEGHWLHIVGGMEMNLVRTPADPDTGLPIRNANPYGYNIEVLYSRVKRDFEYELGLGFNAVNYDPFTEFIADGRPDYQTEEDEREVVFSRTRLKILSVPMKLKFHFINNGRWSVYAGVGLNHDFIARIDYEISDTQLNALPVCVPGTTCIQQTPTLPSLYDQRTYTTGLFNNGPVVQAFDVATRSNNYILRGSLSLGAERNIGNKVAAYLRADYLPTLYNSEIGPYNERINKLAIGMGFKFRLKD